MPTKFSDGAAHGVAQVLAAEGTFEALLGSPDQGAQEGQQAHQAPLHHDLQEGVVVMDEPEPGGEVVVMWSHPRRRW